jgi:hypothetical protein
MRRFLVAVVLMFLPSVMQAGSGMALNVEGQTLVATGLTPGGQVVWFTVARQAADYAEQIVPFSAMTVADKTGEAQLTLPHQPGSQSIWAAVDLATGGLSTGVPAASTLQQLPAGTLKVKSHSGEADQLQDPASYAEVLWVRPGVGAWTLAVADDGPRNQGGRGQVLFAIDQMQPLGNSPAAPSHVGAGDLVLAVHPHQMVISQLAVGAQP